MKTKKPTAIVYNWTEKGNVTLISDVYFQEGLFDEVLIYSIPYTGNIFEDYNKYKPELIVFFGRDNIEIETNLRKFFLKYDELIPDNVLANDIVCQSVFNSCKFFRPRFSMFTSAYQTGPRILRTYESLKNQTMTNWEWVVLDDSPDELTWELLKEISNKDFRVKIHRVFPLTGGNIGLAKHRAAMLCEGDWLIELDHDDGLISTCLETCNDAILKYPDGKFLYTNCCELFDDGEMKHFDYDWTGNYYARHDNFFDFGYAGHSWELVDGKNYLTHHYPSVNPLTIRYNISMPNHARMWEREFYHQIGGHNKRMPVADDLEIIIRSFLNTRFIHVKRLLYLQYNNRNSTVDNNSQDINRRARLIRDHYDLAIHNRILELGFHDWNWDEEKGHSQKFQNNTPIRKYYEEEQVMNYIYE